MSFKRFFLSAITMVALASAASAADAKMKGDSFNILILTDLSSVYADNSGPGVVEGVKLAVEDFGGKVNGVPINVTVVDNKLNAALSVNKARELIDSKGVNLITDVTSSAAAIAVAKLANERKIITTFVSPGSTALTNEDCGKYTWHYAYDTSAMAIPATKVTQAGAKKWYFITADYAFGHSLLEQFTKAVKDAGGEVVGSDLVPFPSDDFSSYLLKAQAAGAQAIGLLESGQDLRNAIKQANEFGLIKAGIKIVPGQMNLSGVKALGPKPWAGINAGVMWYWNLDDQTRAWSERFHKDLGFWPNGLHAGNYSAVTQILKTVQKIGTDDPDQIIAAIEGTKFSDLFAHNATWRKKDHLVTHDMYVIQVNGPDEIKREGDYFKVINTVPADEAFPPASESTCKHDW
jgi:branched-chain amino acid transport system substrate-binding protein